MDTVVKHGSHNQASHNPHKGGASDDLPEGWSRRDTKAELRQRIGEWARSDEERERLVSERDTWDVYDGPNGSKVIVDRNANIPAPAVKEQLETVATLQSIAPVNRLQVEIADRAFEEEGMPPSVKGMTKLHGEVIYLRPTAVTEGVDHGNGQLMPAFQSKPQLYSTVHEYGHVLDKRSAATAREDHDNVFLTPNQGGASRYAYDGDAEGNRGREAFAEAWTGWVSSTGQSTKPFVRYFADKYQWDSGGDGRPPSAGFAKQEADVFLADTFTAEGAVVRPTGAIIEAEDVAKAVYVAFEPGLRPVLKHGTHDQSSHGRRGGGGSSLTLDAGVAQSIVERVRANGGLSVNMVDGSEPPTGFMVAKGGKQSAIVDADEFYDPVKGPEAMSSFLKENRELSEGAYLGLWHNEANGKVYLDVSENIMDRATAVAAGRERDQISIWDVVNREEIDTGGTGAVGKAVAGSETAGPVEDVGSGDRRVRKESVGEGGGAVVVVFEPGLRPVLKHGSHDQSSHGRRGGGGADAASAIEQLRGVPGQYTPPGGGTMRGQNFDTDEPSSRRVPGKTWIEEYEEQREAIARALIDGDFSGLDIPSSRMAMNLGSAIGRVERRIARVAERVGIKRKKRWRFTDEEANRLRESYYERYGRPSWLGKALDWLEKHLGGAHDQKSHGRGGGAADPAASNPAYRGRVDKIRQWQKGGGPSAALMQKAMSEDLEPEEYAALKAGMENVYGVRVTGDNKSGLESTIQSEVTDVYAGNGYIQVHGKLVDADSGAYLGKFERSFSEDYNGGIQVEHVWFRIDDPDYRGTGFGTEFIRQQEDFYISQGMSRITVHAGLEDGGYTWARAGFDWDSEQGGYAFGSVYDHLDSYLYSGGSDPGGFFASSMAAMDGSSTDLDIPSPNALAMHGYTPGATTWPGKEAMTGSDWYGEKLLPPPPPPDPNQPTQLTFDGL